VINEDKTSAATTVYTALRSIDSLKVLLSPFLPFSAERLNTTFGYNQPLFGEQKIVTIEEEKRTHRVLTYDPSRADGRWVYSELKPGQRLGKPTPLYKKLDDAIVEQERVRLGRPVG
jgi:methionyl-tRNA synthetase